MSSTEPAANEGRPGLIVVVVAAVLLAVSGFVYWQPASDTVLTPTDQEIATSVADTEATPPIVPAFDLVRISRGGTGVVAGRMAPGATIELTVNGDIVSTALADDNGDWVIILEEPLPVGTAELNLIGRLADGVDTVEAEEVVVVAVPERSEESYIAREQSGVIAVASSREGASASRILQRPGQTPENGVAGGLAIDTVDYGDVDTLWVTGRALPRTEIRLYLDGAFQGSARASDAGRWEIPLQTSLSDGPHVFRLDQTMTDGKVQLRIEQPFELGAPIDLRQARAGVLVRPGNSLWHIARRVYGRGNQYTLIFQENSEQIKDADLIYPGQLFKLPTGGEGG